MKECVRKVLRGIAIVMLTVGFVGSIIYLLNYKSDYSSRMVRSEIIQESTETNQ